MSLVTLRLAAVLLWISAAGLGLCCLIGIRSLMTTGDIAYVFGLPTFGRGPFEQHGLPTTAPLVGAFLLVCLLEAIAGWLVWTGHLSGGVLALALLPAGALFWWGFALPFSTNSCGGPDPDHPGRVAPAPLASALWARINSDFVFELGWWVEGGL